MRTLHVKLGRELLGLRWQALAICVVMACGVAMVVMSLSTLDSLERTRRDFYDRHGFPDVFAHVKRAPNSLVPRLAALPGVACVETRTVADVTLDVPGLSEPATGRIVSLPDRGAPRLNTLHLRRGRFLEPGRAGEAIISEAFAHAHGFVPGDSLRAVMNGRMRRLLIVGVALSPEYVYSVRPGELLPDDKRFGVLWMANRELSKRLRLKRCSRRRRLAIGPASSNDSACDAGSRRRRAWRGETSNDDPGGRCCQASASRWRSRFSCWATSRKTRSNTSSIGSSTRSCGRT